MRTKPSRTSTKSARYIKSNYNPLFDGVDANKENAERHALAQIKHNTKDLSKDVPRGVPGGNGAGVPDSPCGAGGSSKGPSTDPTVKNPPSFVKRVPDLPVDEAAAAFEAYVTDPTSTSLVLYISERYDVIGWDGPPTSPLCRRVVTRTHDGFTRNFYRLDEQMFRRVCNECDRVLASGEASIDEVDELFAKLDVVVEYARGKGWMASPSPSLS